MFLRQGFFFAFRIGEASFIVVNSDDLTADQRTAAETFAAWLKGPSDGTPFVLSGFAGSGKTFLSMRLLRLVEEAGLCWTVVAPTHKAVGVLRQALDLEGLQPTWYPSTIHRLLRLKLKRSAEAELCEPTEQTAMALENLGLVLIDEASMVDSTLLGIALQCAHPFKTRLVFVGDPAQLPPVGEGSSPVFALQRACSATLTEVVRQHSRAWDRGRSSTYPFLEMIGLKVEKLDRVLHGWHVFAPAANRLPAPRAH